jgi:hypothetical protein
MLKVYLDSFVFFYIWSIDILRIGRGPNDQGLQGWPQGNNRGCYFWIHLQIDPVVNTNNAYNDKAWHILIIELA